MSEPEVLMAGGKVSSSKIPAIHLIPTQALDGLAERFQTGTDRKGDKAWNAITDNQEVLQDKAFLIERCSHIIRHTLLLRDQLVRGQIEGEETMYENAGSIAWGGALMLCATAQGAPVKKVDAPFNVNAPGYRLITPGDGYWCKSKVYTEELNKAHDGMFYSKLLSNVHWTPRGKAVKLDHGMSEAEVRGYDLIGS